MAYKEKRSFDDKYQPADIEARCQAFWDEQKVYAYNPDAPAEATYSVDTPPPTVSGSLHIGHIMGYTQADVKIRYQRMCGKSVFNPIGWDDNGLPTERRVQNYYNIACNPHVPYDKNFVPVHVENNKEPRKEVSRQNFIEACHMLTKEDEKVFENMFRRMGFSLDWDIQYTTIGKDSIRISQASFLDLVKKGMVSSVEAPTMWDVDFQSAIAQAEIEDREVDGFFHDLRFNIQGEPDKFLTIATTRPEFLPACIAVVAHPDDERYRPYFGKTAIVPLFNIPVPILASEHAEKDKGTGILMVCTFGDAADVAWWKQSHLPVKQIIGRDGRLMPIVYGEGAFVSLDVPKARVCYDQIAGLPVKKARAKLVEMLQESGDLLSQPRPIKHMVKFYEKGSQPLEFVSSRQWFVDILSHKQKWIERGQEIQWFPPYMRSRYEAWVNGLNQNWCISRQRFFGVPFPVWYPLDAQGNPNYDAPIFADEARLPVDPTVDTPTGYTESQRGQPNGFVGDTDIMDTWATSSVTPQIAMAAAPKGSHLSMPFDMRYMGHDIIRTWAFYTIMKADANAGTIPWKQAHVNGFVLDPDRKKMSKSKGNVITPIALVETYSADGVRYWAARNKLGIDTLFEETVMGQGKKLVMKMYNASKFVMNIVSASPLAQQAEYVPYIKEPLDKAWACKLAQTLAGATVAFQNSDYAAALEAVEMRFWDFCDNYLEIVKARAYAGDTSAVASLMLTIDLFAKLFAPFCPFIAEEVYQARCWANTTDSVHAQRWPQVEEWASVISENADLYDALTPVVAEIRKTKTMANTSQKTPVKNVRILAPAKQIELLKQAEQDLVNVGSLLPGALHYEEADTIMADQVELELPKKE